MSSGNRSGLTGRRFSQIRHGRGRKPTEGELQEYAKVRADLAVTGPKLARMFSTAIGEAVAAGKVVGCDLSDVVDLHGEQYGPLTAHDVLEQGRRGLRGRRALKAALFARVRQVRSSTSIAQTRRAGRAARPRGRRVARRGARARSPGRRTNAGDGDPEPDLAAQLARLICERGSCSACRLAKELGRRKADVLAALHLGPFVQVGRGRAATWDVVPVPPVVELYERAVWRARRRGVIDGWEAIELLLEPKPRVLAMLAEVAA
jgi:hypothetical protein